MGVSFSCPFADFDDLEDNFEALIVRSISFKDDNDVKNTWRSVSFNGRDTEPSILKSFGSLNFNRRTLNPFHLETMFSNKNTSLPKEKSPLRSTNIKDKEIGDSFPAKNTLTEAVPESPSLKSSSPKHEAAVKLQKVYKSFRTRRRLADCAVLVEQHWWKLLDFAKLKRNSVSFFDISKPETAVSRWSRARARAAMVGKGLSKDIKAKKLALEHWLEAIDPRHRYGHNLHFYYVDWLQCKSRQPFFYWLDVGEGREVNLDECPRSKLQQQCIKYLGPKEREAYEVIVEDRKLLYKQSRVLIDSSEGPKDTKCIFVLSTSKRLYVGKKKKGTFQHSSFLAGGATSAAGRLVAEKGVLKSIWPHSGHYRPTEENFQEFVSFLKENNVDLSDVKIDPMDEDSSWNQNGTNIDMRRNFSEPNFRLSSWSQTHIGHRSNSSKLDSGMSSWSQHGTEISLRSKSSKVDIDQSLTQLTTDKTNTEEKLECNQSFCLEGIGEIDEPENTDLFEKQESKGREMAFGGDETMEDSSAVEHDYLFKKLYLFEEEEQDDEEVPQEKILHRINSKKEMNSYQLGKQLSFRWTTGAGPRIGCVRDYPTELQFRALEEVNLSPRSRGHSRGYSLPQNMACPSPRSPVTSLLKESNRRSSSSNSNSNSNNQC